MIYEDLRLLHEDIERLEQAVSDRVLLDPQNIRSRLVRDHEIANFLHLIQSQSERALKIYNDEQSARTREVQYISTGDPFQSFNEELNQLRDFHKRNPNESVENLERAYKRTDDTGFKFSGDVDGMFTGEEGHGRFFDLIMLHENFLNLPGVKGVRKYTYMQYLDVFDQFDAKKYPVARQDRVSESYFQYVSSLAQYLESFVQRIRPIEDLDKLFKTFDDDFAKAWDEDTVPGWESTRAVTVDRNGDAPMTEGTGEGIWCADCEKEFKNDNVYKAHLSGKKHIKNANARQAQQKVDEVSTTNGNTASSDIITRIKERAVAEREHRVRKLCDAMQTQRTDTRVNVERKAGMTDKERQAELDALYAEDAEMTGARDGNEQAGPGEEDGEEKIYNPLKLPLAWDGKPIPFWLYKLHGLGVEFPCEICGNFVYMGRRAFDKHFSEQRHLYGLQCLGVTKQTGLFREITHIADAEKLWEKLERDRARELERKGGQDGSGVVEMEDSEGNVMPKKVYDDLLKAGVL